MGAALSSWTEASGSAASAAAPPPPPQPAAAHDQNVLPTAEASRTPGAAADPYIGRAVAGRFLVESLLGQGGMGKVYRAKHLGLDRTVCLKMLRPQLLEDPTVVGRFEREAKAASRLNHQHSIQTLDFGQDEHGTLYIVMEFVNGRDLAKLLNDEFPLGEERIAHLMAQVLSALAEAHENKVVHRDLKPENIMVEVRRDNPDFVKVLDFGIARIQDPELPGLTRADMVCGTPLYMSPEQATGSEFDGRADLYAVGVILYQLVTRHLPFEGNNPMEILTKHVRDLPVPPRIRRPEVTVSPEMEALILKALSKEPADRYQSAVEMREALLEIGERARNLRKSAELAAAAASTEHREKQAAELAAHQAAQRQMLEDPQATVVGPAVDAAASSPKSRFLIPAVLGALLLGGGVLGGVLYSGAGASKSEQSNAALASAPRSSPPTSAQPAAPSEHAAEDQEKEGQKDGAPVDSPGDADTRVEVEAKQPKAQPQAAVESEAPRKRAAPAKPASQVAKAAPAVKRAAPSLNPARAEELADDADLLFEEGRFGEAVGKYREAIASNPKLTRAHRGLFRAGFAGGNKAAAKSGAEAYLKLAPKAPDGDMIRRQLETM